MSLRWIFFPLMALLLGACSVSADFPPVPRERVVSPGIQSRTTVYNEPYYDDGYYQEYDANVTVTIGGYPYYYRYYPEYGWIYVRPYYVGRTLYWYDLGGRRIHRGDWVMQYPRYGERYRYQHYTGGFYNEPPRSYAPRRHEPARVYRRMSEGPGHVDPPVAWSQQPASRPQWNNDRFHERHDGRQANIGWSQSAPVQHDWRHERHANQAVPPAQPQPQHHARTPQSGPAPVPIQRPQQAAPHPHQGPPPQAGQQQGGGRHPVQGQGGQPTQTKRDDNKDGRHRHPG